MIGGGIYSCARQEGAAPRHSDQPCPVESDVKVTIFLQPIRAWGQHSNNNEIDVLVMFRISYVRLYCLLFHAHKELDILVMVHETLGKDSKRN
jgi:hypothetical protein